MIAARPRTLIQAHADALDGMASSLVVLGLALVLAFAAVAGLSA